MALVIERIERVEERESRDGRRITSRNQVVWCVVETTTCELRAEYLTRREAVARLKSLIAKEAK